MHHRVGEIGLIKHIAVIKDLDEGTGIEYFGLQQ